MCSPPRVLSPPVAVRLTPFTLFKLPSHPSPLVTPYCCLCLWVFVLFVRCFLFCPTYEWDHMVLALLLSHKKRWNTAICDNMDGAWEGQAKWSKSDEKAQAFLRIYLLIKILPIPFYMLNKCNYKTTKILVENSFAKDNAMFLCNTRCRTGAIIHITGINIHLEETIMWNTELF